MQIVAKVIDYEISKRELDWECSKALAPNQERSIQQALERLIDRCLLFTQAIEHGITVSDDEYDEALLELIEQDEPFGFSSAVIQELTARELETLVRRQLIIKKYIQTLCPETLPITTDKLKEFYLDNRDYFTKPEKVHCAHILVRGSDEEASAKAEAIYKGIRDEDDFLSQSQICSDCPSSADCGDLGWFPRGIMIPEIENVAFSLQLHEISKPFLSSYGYHILLLLDKTPKEDIPFEEIKDSLFARMQQIEKEYLINRHVSDLRSQFASAIVIY